LNIKVEDTVTEGSSKDDYFIIAIDSTGIKITNRGQWLKDKWNIRKGYLKIHIAVDTKSKKILSVKVTDEHVHDSKVLPILVDNIIKSKDMRIDKVFTDGAYDSNAVFRCLADNEGFTMYQCTKKRQYQQENK